MPECALLNNHMCAGVDGFWRVCCKFRGQPRVDINDMSFSEFIKLDEYQDVVEKMSNGWHKGCITCKNVEQEGRVESLRQYANRTFSIENGIESIEISLSNDCNLRCRMCGPMYSTKWVDLIKQHPETSELQEFDPVLKNVVNHTLNQVIGNEDLSNLKVVKYLGGEPFISTEIVNLFKLLDDRNIIQNIEFHTNTNCTYFPSKFVNYLQKFKRIIITLSIDGYGPLNEYIRDGKSWDVVDKNVLLWNQFKKDTNAILLITPSVQAYNIHDLANIKHYADSHQIKYKFQHVRQPPYFTIDALPKEYLLSVKNNYNWVEVEKAKFNPILFEQLKKHTITFDNAVNKSIKDYIPRLYEYF